MGRRGVTHSLKGLLGKKGKGGGIKRSRDKTENASLRELGVVCEHWGQQGPGEAGRRAEKITQAGGWPSRATGKSIEERSGICWSRGREWDTGKSAKGGKANVSGAKKVQGESLHIQECKGGMHGRARPNQLEMLISVRKDR